MSGARPTRRALLALAGPALARPAIAQPAEPLRLVVGAARGTGADRWARGFAPFLERHWPQSSVTLHNRPGEGGLAAARALAAAAPDSRGIGLVATPALIARAIERSAGGLIESLTFVAAVTEETVVLVAPSGATLSSLRRQGSGGLIGCPPPGSAGQLLADQLAGTLPLTPLAFPNASTARQAVLAGNLAAAVLLLTDVLAALREDRLVALAVGGAGRSALLPDVPSFAEKDLPTPLPTRRGCILAPGMPDGFTAQLRESLRAAVQDPEFAEQAASAGFEPRYLPGEAWFAQLQALRTELGQRWARNPWIARPD